MTYVLSLKEAYEILGERGVKNALSSFYCYVKSDPTSIEVQNFIRQDAFIMDAQDFSRTHLLLNDSLEIAGFFTLIIKTFELTASLSRTKQRKLGIINNYLDCFLIAQLARNFQAKQVIQGSEILIQALNHIRTAYRLVGGIKCAAVEYSDTMKLRDFYGSVGFQEIQEDSQTKNLLALLKIR